MTLLFFFYDEHKVREFIFLKDYVETLSRLL